MNNFVEKFLAYSTIPQMLGPRFWDSSWSIMIFYLLENLKITTVKFLLYFGLLSPRAIRTVPMVPEPQYFQNTTLETLATR